MKLLISESKAFNTEIEASTLNRTDISFRKKSGWLYIQHQDKSEIFSYHRKRKVALTKEGQWDKFYTYFIKKESEQIELQNFELVIEAFREWLGKE